jgi:hypothetical protein
MVRSDDKPRHEEMIRPTNPIIPHETTAVIEEPISKYFLTLSVLILSVVRRHLSKHIESLVKISKHRSLNEWKTT